MKLHTTIFIAIALLINSSAFGQSTQQFDANGFYGGVELGSQYMFGGAQVDGKETIGDGSVLIAGGLIGWKKAYDNNLNFGVEFQLNQPFGEFTNTENPDGVTTVEYNIKLQTALQFNVGYSIGSSKRSIVFGYFAINQTRFDIVIYRSTGNFEQTDFENFGRVGLGYEHYFNNHLSARLLIGSSMDGLEGTNNGVDGKLG